MEIFLPDSSGGITTALKAAVSSSSAKLTIKGTFVLIGVGLDAVYIRFGRATTGDVTATNGIRLPANWVGVLSVPTGANTILHIRETLDSTINVQSGLSDT